MHRQKRYLRLIVVLDAHGEDIDADDEGDEEVQVVARTQCVDGQTQGRVVGIVRPLLGLWSKQTQTNKYMQRRHEEGRISTQTDRKAVSNSALIKVKYYMCPVVCTERCRGQRLKTSSALLFPFSFPHSSKTCLCCNEIPPFLTSQELLL